MKPCCEAEIQKHLHRHRDVARCDTCGTLLIAYDNEEEFAKTTRDLESRGAPFEALEKENLWIVAKPPHAPGGGRPRPPRRGP